MKTAQTIAVAATTSVIAGFLLGGLPAQADSAAEPRDIVIPKSSTVQLPSSFPQETLLPVVPEGDDASNARGAVTYASIAPRINELVRTTDVVTAQVVGTSVRGRDIHLVTVTAPETEAETAQQAAWRDEIKHQPQTAAGNQALLDGYKVPVWTNGNIHGNEWEGTDVILNTIEKLATGDDPETKQLLEKHRFYFTLTTNPDGRVGGFRQNAEGFDPNRDMITAATPEARVVRDLTGELQPTFYLDLHGYTNVLQVEPTGPPHGESYEYDLFLPHAYAAALAIEEAVVAADIPGNTYYDRASGRTTTENTGHIKIPFRDIRAGWDDWPPIFTPQYIAYLGAVTNTVELPHPRTSDPVESKRRTDINVAVGNVLMDSAIDYFAQNDHEMLGNQIETFRRGVAGEPKVDMPADVRPDSIPGPKQWAEIWDELDVFNTEYPRAFVIPVGHGQRSDSDAARLVNHLIANDIQVDLATAPFTIGDTAYDAGTYVVDMHQPLRGMANVLLGDGTDISYRTAAMYDISAWSFAKLWGADVHKVGITTDPEIGIVQTASGDSEKRNAADVLTPVTEAQPVGSIPAAGTYLEFRPAGVGDFQAINVLLSEKVAVSRFDDGTYILGDDAATRAAAERVSRAYGVQFTASDGSRLKDESAEGLEAVKVAYSGPSSLTATTGDRVSLQQLGFGVTDEDRIDAAAINAEGAPALENVDVIWFGTSTGSWSNPTGITDTGVQNLRDFLARGGGIAGQGAYFAAVLKQLGVELTATSATGGSNGIAAVTTPDNSFLRHAAQDWAFVYPATWFTELGENVTAEQFYGEGDFFLSGHWTAERGRDAAAGQASAVSVDLGEGNTAYALGTSPTFRTMPVGNLSWVASALLSAGVASENAIPAPTTPGSSDPGQSGSGPQEPAPNDPSGGADAGGPAVPVPLQDAQNTATAVKPGDDLAVTGGDTPDGLIAALIAVMLGGATLLAVSRRRALHDTRGHSVESG